MKYRIGELYIENFKSIKQTLLNFEDSDLTILDGPNGFGKTSIFDAIELVLTGSIRRIVNNKVADGKKGYEDYLFAKDQSKPVIIKIKLLTNDNDCLILGRKIDPSKLSPIKKKPGEFPSTLHLLSSVQDELTNGNLKDEKGIDEIGQFVYSYNLYHYIEQEECTHLFKKTENDRMVAISKLFNIEQEESEREKLSKASNRLNLNKNKIQKKLEKLKTELDLGVVNQDERKIEYFQLLPNKVSKKEAWDHQEIKALDLNLKSTYYERIDNLQYLIKVYPLFKVANKNEQIYALINNKARLESLLLLYHFQENIENLKKEYSDRQKLSRILSYLEKKDLINPNIQWDIIFEKFSLPLSQESLQDKLTIIRNLKKSSSQLSEMISSLLNTREQLTNHYKKLVDAKGIQDDICPLCGAEWEDYQVLLSQFMLQANQYKEQQDKSSQEEAILLDELYKTQLNNLIEEIKVFIATLISEDVYRTLYVHFEKKVDLTKAKEFFKDLNIELDAYVYRSLSDITDLPLRVEKIQETLRNSIKDVGDFNHEKYEVLKDIYNNVFEKDESLLTEIDITKFEMKKEYLNYIYFLQSSKQYQKYISLNEKYKVIEDAYHSITRSLAIYKKNIENYRANMIKEIEIPFFIYSGKIIQNYQRGIGIFIREEDKETDDSQIKSIRFVPPGKTDHDIVHTFSSGQLSATVLAFTFALNKVYNNTGLNTILIDDPIQTMDEINMASFVELLRNDFGDRQIILSTHENQISLYIRYKFSKYGYQTRKISVKEKLYI
jgi:DNA repair protein SbcC/Rad50